MNGQDYSNVIEFELDKTLHCTCLKITIVILWIERNEDEIQLCSNHHGWTPEGIHVTSCIFLLQLVIALNYKIQ